MLMAASGSAVDLPLPLRLPTSCIFSWLFASRLLVSPSNVCYAIAGCHFVQVHSAMITAALTGQVDLLRLLESSTVRKS